MTSDPGSDDAIGTQAAHWFAVMRGPDADARRPEFDAWRTSDVRRAKAYDEVADLFAISAGAARVTADRVQPSDKCEANSRPARIGRFAVAAGLAAIVAIGALSWTQVTQMKTATRAAGPAMIAADAAARIQHLGDGSIVLLGAASLVTANLSAAVREITLDKGRARFIVAHDPARDFVVIGHGRTITARDAIFDVAVDNDTTHVSVVAGDVEILAGSDTGVRTVSAGESITLGGGNATTPASAADTPGWPPARAEFDAAPLADVVRIANGIGKPPIVLASQDIGILRLTGTFDIRDTAPLARKIAAALDLDIEVGASEIRLSHRR